VGDYGGLQGHWNERGGQPGRGGAGISEALIATAAGLAAAIPAVVALTTQQQGDKLSG